MSFLSSICTWMSSDMFCRRMLLICFDSTPHIVSSLSYSPFAKKIDTSRFLSRMLPPLIYDPGSRFATTPPPPPPTWYGPKTCVLQHSAWKRCICSVFCMVGCWCGPQPCKFVGVLQPTFRKRVICNVSASTSWSSAAAPSSISVSNYHIILNLLLTVFSLGTGLISVYILCLSNFLLECLVFRNWSTLKFS